MAEDLGNALDGRSPGHLRQRLAHHFANHKLAKILALQRKIQDLVLVDRADGNVFLENRNLRYVLLLHGFQSMKNGLVRARNHQFTNFAGRAFGIDDFPCGDGGSRVHVAALVHPQIVINFAEVACAGVRQQRDNKISWPEILGKAQRAGNTTTAGASGKEPFHFCQAPRNDEAFLVVDLNDVVEDFQIHGRGEKILADAFHNIRFCFDGLPGFDEIVVQRAVGIDADNFYFGIFFLQEFADAADGAAGAHAANEVRNLAFAVLPNLGTRGAIVRFGIHWIVVLIRIIRIGNFAREFFRYGIVAARIFRLDGGRADDDFSAESFQEINFFLRLLVGRREDALVTTNRRDQRQSHASVTRSAFNDSAAGLEQAFFFGFVDHADADAVFHGATRIGELRFDVNLRLQALIDAVQTHQGRVANRFEDVVALHQSSRFLRRMSLSLASSREVPLLTGTSHFVTTQRIDYSFHDFEERGDRACQDRTYRAEHRGSPLWGIHAR